MSRFLTALASGRPLLMDGAMGTELIRAGLAEGEFADRWTLQHPDRVLAVHRAYREAGAQVLLTNTFQVARASISWDPRPYPGPRGFSERESLIALQYSATALAQAACGPEGFVLADIGSYSPEAYHLEFSDFTLFRIVLAGVGPADGLLLETCSTPRVRQAVAAVRKFLPGMPVLLSLAYLRTESGAIEARSGHAPEWFARRARGWGVDALGANCGRDIGMEEMIEVIRRYRQETDLPLFARPNAGTPRRRGKRWVYPGTPAKLAARLPELLAAGASMVGGCCGTTPGHIAAFREVLKRRALTTDHTNSTNKRQKRQQE
jgi:5-methyltetrahydrofolate--homocysteine methyltransferase